jgi:biotin synthase
VLMPNATPLRYRKHYQLYPGKAGPDAEPAECRRRAEEVVVAMGRRVAADHGHSRRRLTAALPS